MLEGGDVILHQGLRIVLVPVQPIGEGIRPAEYAVAIERNVTMTTSDAVALVADIHRPKMNGAAPTILVRIPFSRTFRNSLSADAVGRFWASRRYIVVVQGTRGRFKSGGAFYPLRHERQDGIETLQWLARQPWFDGRLGMWGGSAFGHTQWALADQSRPGPTALMIQIASTSFGEMFHPGGALSLESALFWAARSGGPADVDPSSTALERGLEGFPVIEADDRAVGNVPFFDDWLVHDRADPYWRAIDGEDRARNIKAPVLLMGGWYDPFLPTQIRDFQTIRREADPRVALGTHLIVGPWMHADAVRFPDGSTGDPYRRASLAPSIPWFDHHLRGMPLADSLAAPVRLYVMGENVWRSEPEWPLARTRYTPLYLRSAGRANSGAGDGRLTRGAPGAPEPADAYVYDPRDPVPSRGGAMLSARAGIALQNDIATFLRLGLQAPHPQNGARTCAPWAGSSRRATRRPERDRSARRAAAAGEVCGRREEDGLTVTGVSATYGGKWRSTPTPL